MDYPKEFYEREIKVFEHLVENDCASLSCAKGEELAGEYWPAIVEEYAKAGAVVASNGGDIFLTRAHLLNPFNAACESKLRELCNAEADRELANLERLENIRCGRKALEISERTAKWNKRSIIITGIVALGQIVQWILLIAQRLSTP